MPLNCLPETTTVAALEAKRTAAAGQCLVDWAAWGGAVADNQADLLPLARAGVPGFKCFLIYPGCDGFTMIDREQLERALPAIAESGLPLLVHAELAGPIDAALATPARDADWRKYATYLASRPDEAELEAIRLMIHLCRQYGFRLHIVHLATAHALAELHAARAEGLPITVETCPHYLHFAAEDIADGATLNQVRAAHPRPGQPRGTMGRARPHAKRHDRHDRHRPFAVPSGDEARRRRPLRSRLGRNRQPLRRSAGGLDGRRSPRLLAGRYRPLDVLRPRRARRLERPGRRARSRAAKRTSSSSIPTPSSP